MYICLFFAHHRGSALVGESGKLESLSSICLSVYFNTIARTSVVEPEPPEPYHFDPRTGTGTVALL